MSSTRLTGQHKYNVDDTRVWLQISVILDGLQLTERETLMCIIEGIGRLNDDKPGDPIRDDKLTFTYTWIQVVLEDQSTPEGRFLNDIAGLTLRGIAEWMTKNDCFRELKVGIYYDQNFCGVAEVTLLRPMEGATVKVASASAHTPIS